MRLAEIRTESDVRTSRQLSCHIKSRVLGTGGRADSLIAAQCLDTANRYAWIIGEFGTNIHVVLRAKLDKRLHRRHFGKGFSVRGDSRPYI